MDCDEGVGLVFRRDSAAAGKGDEGVVRSGVDDFDAARGEEFAGAQGDVEDKVLFEQASVGRDAAGVLAAVAGVELHADRAVRRDRRGEKRRLQQYDVQWNAMAVVNRHNAQEPEAFYRFFKSIGCQYIQFAPIVEHAPDGGWTPETVTPEAWGAFLCRLFDEWLRQEDIGRVFVQLFDATLANWVGEVPGVCTLGAQCGHALVMEWNGDVYSCDHFVDAKHRLGNVMQRPLVEMIEDPRQRTFGADKETRLPLECQLCRWSSLCHGECPKNRLPSGLNYICEGYKQFFAHSSEVMKQLKRELESR